MKKLFLFITFASIINSALAQKSCATIADVCAQANNTEVLYTGTATTTFYTSGGILIQDETGHLYVKNGTLSEYGSSKVNTKMKITNILGTFKSATNSEMPHIHIEFNDDANAIKIVESSATFNITDISINDLIANPTQYECQPIRLTDIETFESNNAYYLGSENNKISLLKGWDVTIPTRGTFEGYYGSSDGTKGFVIPSANHVTATAYKTILDLKEAFYDNNPQNPLSIIDPVTVNYIRTNTDNSIDVYAQQTTIMYGMPETKGILLKIESYDGTINIGDELSGIKGLFSHFELDNNGKIAHGSTMTISTVDARNIVIESKNNKQNTTLIDDLEYVTDGNTINYEFILAITPKGTITKSADQYILKSGSKSIILEGLDFSQYEGQNFAVAGVIDAGNIHPGKTTIVLRKETDIIATSYTFNSIAEIKEAGEPLATGTTYTLTSNALVTHIHSWAGVDATIYGIFIQDSTAGLYIETLSNPNIAIGDSINGITGTYHKYLSLKEGTNLTIISSNNLDKIQPEEVTMETLASNPEKYASQVVKLMGVGHGSRQVDNYGQTQTENYLYQDSYEMIYDIWNYTLYEYNNIIGVFDYGSYQPFSIVPLSQNHIEESEYLGVAIDNISSESQTIYIDNNVVFAPEATQLKLYTLNGLLIKDIKANTYDISHLQSGLYIITAQYNNHVSTIKIVK